MSRGTAREGKDLRRIREEVLADGKCVGTAVPDKWFPRDGFTLKEYYEYAQWACRGCPVREECAALGLQLDTEGVWGGIYLTPRTASHSPERAQPAKQEAAGDGARGGRVA